MASHDSQENPGPIPLGSISLPPDALSRHILVHGASGSGRGILINQLKRHCLQRVGDGHRVFIWDYLGHERQYLQPLGLPCPVSYVNPFDQRGVGIAVSRELDTDFAARDFANEIVHPEANPDDPTYVFTENARSIFYHLIRTFQQFAPGQWDLTDVVGACETRKNLFKVLDRTPSGKAKRETVFADERQGAGVLFILEAMTYDLRPLAAAMAHSENITLKEWAAAGESVVVLQYHDRARQVLRPFYRWVFSRAVGHVLAAKGDPKASFSFILDKVEHAPFGNQLLTLAREGRACGAGIVLGVRDASAFMSAWGDGAAELPAMCATQAHLRVDGVGAEWASQCLGETARHQGDGSEEMSAAIDPIEFASLPGAHVQPEHGLTVTAIVATPERGPMTMTATHMDAEGVSLRPDHAIPAFVERPANELDFDDWDEEDKRRLGLGEEP